MMYNYDDRSTGAADDLWLHRRSISVRWECSQLDVYVCRRKPACNAHLAQRSPFSVVCIILPVLSAVAKI